MYSFKRVFETTGEVSQHGETSEQREEDYYVQNCNSKSVW